MILLAPVRALGGISTWARGIQSQNWDRLRTIDTSPPLRAPSQKLGPLLALLGLAHGTGVWSRAIAYALLEKDVVWATVSPSIGFRVRDVPFLLISRALKVRTIVHIHGSDLQGLLGRTKHSQWWANTGLRVAGTVVVLDKDTQAQLEAGCRRRVERLPNFIDSGALRANPKTPPAHWIYVGRVSIDKGSQTLLEIASLLSPKAELRVMGPIDPAIESTFRDAARELPLFLTGQISADEVKKEMLAADILVLPSHHEGFPLAVLEAMALGLPVISSDVGACREMLIDGPETAAGATLPNPVLIGSRKFALLALDYASSPTWLQRNGGGPARVQQRYDAERVISAMRAILDQGST